MAAAPREVSTNGGIYGAFRDAAPDDWGRLVIAAERRVPPEGLSEIDLLLATNATRVGNQDFRSSPNDPEPELQPPGFSQMEKILETAAKIEAGAAISPHLLRLLRQGTSVGGAQPKCTVAWQNGLWIAKFPSKEDTLNIPRIEYAAMTLAEKCGIRIPALRQSTGCSDLEIRPLSPSFARCEEAFGRANAFGFLGTNEHCFYLDRINRIYRIEKALI